MKHLILPTAVIIVLSLLVLGFDGCQVNPLLKPPVLPEVEEVQDRQPVLTPETYLTEQEVRAYMVIHDITLTDVDNADIQYAVLDMTDADGIRTIYLLVQRTTRDAPLLEWEFTIYNEPTISEILVDWGDDTSILYPINVHETDTVNITPILVHNQLKFWIDISN